MSNCGNCNFFLAYEFTDRDKDVCPDDLCVNPAFPKVVTVTPMSACGYYAEIDSWGVLAYDLLKKETGFI